MKNNIPFILSLLILDQLAAQPIVLKDAKLINGSGKVIDNPLVMIVGKHRVPISPKMLIPDDTTVMDLGNFTLLPGLIDAHVHPNNILMTFRKQGNMRISLP